MIKIFYSPLMLRRAAEILKTVTDMFPRGGQRLAREEYTQKTYGLSFDYLLKAGRKNRECPSARVLRNLGLELWVKDPRTGEMEKVEYELQWDWNPHRPTDLRSRANPTSSSD